MRWALAAFVVAWSAIASAQTFDLPPAFHEQAGGADLKALAKPGDAITVQDYAAGGVQLTAVTWTFHLDPPITRESIAAFERGLLKRTTPADVSPISQTIDLERDPIVADAFGSIANDRIHHRRLYVVDAEGLVHLWWLICKGPAIAVGECEQAKRTMKLEVAHAVALPIDPRPVPANTAVGVGAPAVSLPWHIVLPVGYREAVPEGKAISVQMFTAMRGLAAVEVHGFVSRGPVRLVVIATRMPAGDKTPRDAIANMDAGMTDGLRSRVPGAPKEVSAERRALPVIGDNIVGAESFIEYERRTLYAVDHDDEIYAFNAVCMGPRLERGICAKALATMELAVPDEVSAESGAWDQKPHQLRNVLLAVVAGLGGVAWIVMKRYRRRRRPIEPPIAIDPS